jgi:D-alanyl-D-alanine carboxypeptidase
LYVTVPKGTVDQLQAELVSQQPLIAPLKAGERVATLRVSHDGKPLAEYPVIALEDIAAAGFFARTWDSVRLWFR